MQGVKHGGDRSHEDFEKISVGFVQHQPCDFGCVFPHWSSVTVCVQWGQDPCILLGS